MEQLRKEAFGEWVNHLHAFKNPDKTIPPGENVVFPSEDEVENNRTLLILEEGLPKGVKEKKHDTILGMGDLQDSVGVGHCTRVYQEPACAL